MAGGKKAKRGGTAKKKQLADASPPIERHTAFIETSDGPERVFPREVRKTIYRYLLLGSNFKQQRGSEMWNTKGFADHYQFEVNLLRANKAIYTEGMCQYDNPILHQSPFADLHQRERFSTERTRSPSCRSRSKLSGTA